MPLFAPHVWEHHHGKIAAFWAALVLVPLAAFAGSRSALGALLHTALLEYMPFILLLFALFTVAGGIRDHAATCTARRLTNTRPAR